MTRSAWFALSLVFTLPLAAGETIPGDRQLELHNLLIQDCGSCHGLKMKGGLGPALLPINLQGKSAEYLSSVILNGRPGTAMPPWRSLLTPAEARWMAERLLQEDLQ
jgi:cytochrome c55X